jgi:hypothetical protein
MTGQLRTLARATFDGFFESELMPPGLPQVRLLIFVIAALMFPATQVPGRAWPVYARAARFQPEVLDLLMWPHKLLFITLAMVGTATVTLVIWDNVFPDRRDAFIIGHLPMRTRTVVAARLVALSTLMGVIGVASALPSALFYGFTAGGYSAGGPPRTMVAHFVATIGASSFAFLLLLSLQGVLINLVSGRSLQRGMVLLQFLFVVATLESLLFMFPVVHALERAMVPGAVQPVWMTWMPPAWFLGLYEVLAGSTRPIGNLAVRAVIALAVLLPLAFGVYAVTYARLTRRAVESTDAEQIRGGVVRERLVAWLANRLTGSPIASAVCRYSILTLLRSRRHRLLFTIFAGMGATAAATGLLIPFSRHGRLLWILTPESFLPVGLVLVFFLVAGLRTLFSIPSEPAANWIFKLSDAEDARLHVRGAAAAMMAMGVLPVVILLAPLHVLVLGRTVTFTHCALLLAAGFLLCQILLRHFRRVPFTAPYNPPTARVRIMWPLWLIGFSQFSYMLSFVEAKLLDHAWSAATLIGALLAAGLAVRFFNEKPLKGTRVLSFEDDEEHALVTLELFGAIPASSSRTTA